MRAVHGAVEQILGNLLSNALRPALRAPDAPKGGTGPVETWCSGRPAPVAARPS
ncbi:hypothetical protein [Streptomyces sp. NPDC096311]|uniref:hypothetical protein n=1 Tax=Streptomyces sp. NPDC096311 TaxID=3366083 RepID=UPI00381677CB